VAADARRIPVEARGASERPPAWGLRSAGSDARRGVPCAALRQVSAGFYIRSRSMAAKSNNNRSNNGKQKKGKDAIELLTEDHEKVLELLEDMEETTSRGRKKRGELLLEIALEVRTHARIEEEIFYPAFQKAAKTGEDEQKFHEAAEEHALVDVVLPKLEACDPGTEEFGALAKVLKDLIEHHIEEEEEELFPRARTLLGQARVSELGEELSARKPEVQDELGAVGARSIGAASSRR
jgi:hemerythrin-like domain-containing protein